MKINPYEVGLRFSSKAGSGNTDRFSRVIFRYFRLGADLGVLVRAVKAVGGRIWYKGEEK